MSPSNGVTIHMFPSDPAIDEQVNTILAEAGNDQLHSFSLIGHATGSDLVKVRLKAALATGETTYIWEYGLNGKLRRDDGSHDDDPLVTVPAGSVDWKLLATDLQTHTVGCHYGGDLVADFLIDQGVATHVMCIDQAGEMGRRGYAPGSARIDGRPIPDRVAITSESDMESALSLATRAFPQDDVFAIQADMPAQTLRFVADLDPSIAEATGRHWALEMATTMSQSDGNPDGWQPPAVRFGPDYSRFNPANHETGPVQPFSLDALTAADLVGICTGLEARGIDVTQVDLLEVTSTDGQNLNTRVVLDDGQVITGTLP